MMSLVSRLVRVSIPVPPALADLITTLAWASIVLLGLCVLTALLALVLAATERKRLTVRGWLALAWLASLLVPVLAEGACLLVLHMLAAQPVRPPPLIPPPDDQQRLMAQILVPIGAFAITMLCLAWLTGRLVLAPLTAMRHAARQIAASDLDISLPAPQLREVAEVAYALSAMSGALRHALVRQAELEQERRLFVSAIAHDLRTPLFALRGYLEGLREGIARTPARTERYVAICQDQADILERLVADLFTYARLEYLEQAPEREPLDLGTLLRNAVASITPGAESKGISLRLAAPQAACWVIGDRHMLRRAVDNLLENAIAFTSSGGSVHVSWQRDGDACVFSIRDSGPGFAPEDLQHLFQPLYRGDPSRSRQTGGAGLGLATAHRILRAHDGDLTAANATTGGAHLTARLPAYHAPAQLETLPERLRAAR